MSDGREFKGAWTPAATYYNGDIVDNGGIFPSLTQQVYSIRRF